VSNTGGIHLRVLPHQNTGLSLHRHAAELPQIDIFEAGDDTMWRIIVPLLQFAVDCLLGLAAFAVLATLICGVWESASWRRNHHHEPFMM
jgi:hypothetical protein